MQRSTLLLILLISIASTSDAGDWPNFRGPTHDGLAAEETLFDSWPEDGPAVVWSREIGQGYSGFVVVGKRAFTQEQTLYHQALICLDTNTGKTLWSYRYGWPHEGGGLYPGPRATPTVDGDRVYFTSPNGLVGCVAIETGKLVWSRNYKEEFQGKGTDFGVSASLLIWRSQMIIPVGGPDASLIAVDAATGEIIWKCGNLPASYATPIIIPLNDRHVVVAPLENSLLLADAETGEKLLEQDISSGYDEHSAAPIYREPMLFTSGPFRSGGTQYRLDLPEDEASFSMKIEWFTQQMSNDIASSVLIGEHLYGFDLREPQSRLHRPSRGHFRCLSWGDGSKAWNSQEPGHANIIAADGKLLMFNDRGELLLCRATPDRYEELARCSVFPQDVCWTPPALANGRVYLRTHQQAVCLQVGPSMASPDTISASEPTTTVASIRGSRRFDPTVLLGGEREFPAATPPWPEIQWWYAVNLMLLAVIAGVFAALDRLDKKDKWTTVGYWAALIIAGAVTSGIVNPLIPGYVFTWPLAVWAAMQRTAELYVVAPNNQSTKPSPWRARTMLAVFLVVGGIYFHCCRSLGLATEWAFLAGPVVAVPCAMLLAWAGQQGQLARFPVVARIASHLVSFTIFYWAGAMLMKGWIRVAS